MALNKNFPPVQPLRVLTPVATQTETNIAVGVLMICCVALLAAFGASLAAGIVKMAATTSTTAIAICVDYDYNSKPATTTPPLPLIKGWTYDTVSNPGFDPYGPNPMIEAYADYCTIKGVRTSTCSGVGCGLMERYCANSRRSSRYYLYNVSKPTSTLALQSVCPLGCTNGACTKSTTTTPSCTDSDLISGANISNIYIQGTTIGYVLTSSTSPTTSPTLVQITKTDQCSGSTSSTLILTEYSCNGLLVASSSVFCQWGCANGACRTKPIGLNCSESDNAFNDGIDYYTKGTTAGSNGLSYSTSTDVCSGTNGLIEYYCVAVPGSNRTKFSSTFYCPSGFSCSSGACKRNIGAKNCVESDAGLDVFEKGLTSGVMVNSSSTPVTSSTDYCLSSSTVQEFFCTTISGSYQNMTQGTYNCPTGFYCVNGACKK